MLSVTNGSNHYITGASTRDCVFNYTSSSGSDVASQLNTFLICAGPESPVLLKRFTFRNVCQEGSTKTRFLGVIGGAVQVKTRRARSLSLIRSL